MTEKRLDYDRSLVPQETGWWCGPASTQIVLQSKGIRIRESEIAAAIELIENPGRGDDRDGTDYVGLIERYLDGKVPQAKFTSVYMPQDPPTRNQIEKLFSDVKRSIDNGWGAIANIVAPPTNLPRGTKGSTPPPYMKWVTTYHYVAIMGYDDTPGARAVWIADPANFGGITGFWCPLEGRGSISSLIPPKGYCFADLPAAVEPPVVTATPPPVVATSAANRLETMWSEWNAFFIEDAGSVSEVVRAAQSGDSRAKRVLARLEQTNPAALQAFLARKG